MDTVLKRYVLYQMLKRCLYFVDLDFVPRVTSTSFLKRLPSSSTSFLKREKTSLEREISRTLKERMGCLWMVFWAIVCIILFLIGAGLWSVKTGLLQFSSFYSADFKKGCIQQFYLPYPETFSDATLMVAAYNTSLSNCSDLGEFPLPPGAIEQIQINGQSADSITRMFARVIKFDSGLPSEGLLGGKTWVIFTGTEFMDEFEMDFEGDQTQPTILSKYQPGMLCHSGFYQIYSSLRDALKAAVGDDEVIIAGHSLGGALSSIASLDLNVVKTVTFASPRVFNPLGANELSLTRYFNTEDIVPELPPAVFFDWEYAHPPSGGIFFTVNLGTVEANHVDTYLNYFGV
jgi:hypothetical protein